MPYKRKINFTLLAEPTAAAIVFFAAVDGDMLTNLTVLIAAGMLHIKI